MNNTQEQILKDKLNISNWSEIKQEQFNKLVTNISYLDQDTVREVVRQIPNLASKVLSYYGQINKEFNLGSDKDYLMAAHEQQKILLDLLDKSDNPKIKDRIADELLEHSKWIRKEASNNSFFKKVLLAMGGGIVVGFINGGINFFNKVNELAKTPNETTKKKKSDRYLDSKPDSNNDWEKNDWDKNKKDDKKNNNDDWNNNKKNNSNWNNDSRNKKFLTKLKANKIEKRMNFDI